MKKGILKFLHAMRMCWGVMFAAVAVCGIVTTCKNVTPSNIAAVLFCTVVAYLLLRKRKKSIQEPATEEIIPVEIAEPVDAYIETDGVVYRTDDQPISQREVPYLMEAGLRDVLTEQHLNPKFSRSDNDTELRSNFFMRYGSTSQHKTDQFEQLSQQAASEKNIDRKIEILMMALLKYKEVQLWHYEHSRGAALWFQDMYEHMHNSHNPCFSWFDIEKENLLELLWERDNARPIIMSMAENGFLQKDIYAQFAPERKSALQRLLRNMEAERLISRTKKNGTYLVQLIDQTQKAGEA